MVGGKHGRFLTVVHFVYFVLAGGDPGAGAYPFVWLITLPFRIVGIALHGVFGLLTAILMLPVRLLRGPSAI